MTMAPHAGNAGTRFRGGRRVALTGAALMCAFSLSACATEAEELATDGAAQEATAASSSAGTRDGNPVAIATGVNEQTRVAAHMYAQSLQDQGITATVVEAGTERGGLIDALESGEVDVVPDFTGDLYVHVAENETRATPSATPTPVPSASKDPGLVGSLGQLLGFSSEAGPSGDDVYGALPDAMPEGLKILNESPGENTDRFVVTAATAVELELNDLTTVAEHCPDMNVGMPGNYADTAQGIKGLKSYYDCVPKSSPEFPDYAERVDALLNDDVQAAVLPASAPVIEDDDLTVLADPNNLYRPEKLVPVTTGDLTADAISAINGVTDGIRTQDLTMMTRLVTGQDPAMSPEEAATFLREQPR